MKIWLVDGGGLKGQWSVVPILKKKNIGKQVAKA